MKQLKQVKEKNKVGERKKNITQKKKNKKNPKQGDLFYNTKYGS
jgi:hypothetical protein